MVPRVVVGCRARWAAKKASANSNSCNFEWACGYGPIARNMEVNCCQRRCPVEYVRVVDAVHALW